MEADATGKSKNLKNEEWILRMSFLIKKNQKKKAGIVYLYLYLHLLEF